MLGNKVRQKWVMDVDDLSCTLPGMEYLQKMKEHFPEFKITCFTPAFNLKVFTKQVSIEKFKEWQKMVRDTEWIEVAPHGFAHIQREFLETDKKVLTNMIKAIENIFHQADIDFIKVFKAPL